MTPKPKVKVRLTEPQIYRLASELSTVMFSLIWEGDYSPEEAPGEDALYDAMLSALKRIAK